jgi:hypothetical protein
MGARPSRTYTELIQERWWRLPKRFLCRLPPTEPLLCSKVYELGEALTITVA